MACRSSISLSACTTESPHRQPSLALAAHQIFPYAVHASARRLRARIHHFPSFSLMPSASGEIIAKPLYRDSIPCKPQFLLASALGLLPRPAEALPKRCSWSISVYCAYMQPYICSFVFPCPRRNAPPCMPPPDLPQLQRICCHFAGTQTAVAMSLLPMRCGHCFPAGLRFPSGPSVCMREVCNQA